MRKKAFASLCILHRGDFGGAFWFPTAPAQSPRKSQHVRKIKKSDFLLAFFFFMLLSCLGDGSREIINSHILLMRGDTKPHVSAARHRTAEKHMLEGEGLHI